MHNVGSNFFTGKDKFGYRVGTVYEYSYEAETKTGISGATEEQGGLKVTATAEIEVLTKCEFLLTVSLTIIYLKIFTPKNQIDRKILHYSNQIFI